MLIVVMLFFFFYFINYIYHEDTNEGGTKDCEGFH